MGKDTKQTQAYMTLAMDSNLICNRALCSVGQQVDSQHTCRTDAMLHASSLRYVSLLQVPGRGQILQRTS